MDNNVDYSQIFLIKKEKKIIKTLKSKKRLLYSHDMDFLMRHRFIEHEYSDQQDSFGSFISTGYVLLGSEYGRYSAYRFERFVASLPNWIAITISVVSLIVSIVAMLK